METETEERKEAWNEDCVKALAALANTRGGTLWVGVKDDGSVIGWHKDGRDLEAISNQIVDSLHLHPAASPVALRGRYYRRVGNSSRELPTEELPRFLLERTGLTWDALPAQEGLEGISVKTVADFKVLAQSRLPELAPSDTIGQF